MRVEVGDIPQPSTMIGLLLQPYYDMRHRPAQGKGQEMTRKSLWWNESCNSFWQTRDGEHTGNKGQTIETVRESIYPFVH
jgi:hypothetical protein